MRAVSGGFSGSFSGSLSGALFSTVFVLLSSSMAFAERAVVDCGNAGKGEVSMTVKNARMSHERAAELAFQCLKDRNADVLKARLDALKVAKAENDSCGTADKLQMMPLTSWISDRVDNYGQSGGDSKILVREPLSCDGIGTGLFGGYVSGAMISLKITETYKVDASKDSSRQVVIVTLEGPVELNVRKNSPQAPVARGSRTD